MMIDGIPSQPLYFYQKDIIGYIIDPYKLLIHRCPSANASDDRTTAGNSILSPLVAAAFGRYYDHSGGKSN